MNTKSHGSKRPAEHVVKDIRRATRRHFSSEDKIRIVLECLRGEDSIAELCRKEGHAQSLYYTWSKEFLEAGKRRLAFVEQSHLPAKKTLVQLGIAHRTLYRWYDRYREGGPEALDDRPSRPNRVWNRIEPDIRSRIIEMALEQSELSPRELAVRFTDEKHYFVSEATVYRLLKAHDLITSPAFVVIKADEAFHTKTTCANEMWQTDFT